MTALHLSLPQRLSTSGVHINPYKIGSYKPLRGFVGNPKWRGSSILHRL